MTTGTMILSFPLYELAVFAPSPWAAIWLAVLPMQDLLELDTRHRMNIPGTSEGNWQWGFDWTQLPVDLAKRLRHLNSIYGRIP